MTGTWIYAFHTFLFHDQPWEAETELENNRWKLEMILQNNRWNIRREEKTISLPDGRKQLLGYRYSGLPWKDSTFCVMVYPEQIVLEIPVTVPDADAVAAKWEKRLGISADPVCTQSKGECMEETANAIRETILEIYLELEQCSRRNCSKAQIKEHNRLMERLNDTVRTEIGEDRSLYEAVFLPLLEHENQYIRGSAASHCLHHGIPSERCIPILEEIRDTTDNIILRVDCGMSVWVYQHPQHRQEPGRQDGKIQKTNEV
ncbi:MAG: hypothetical protein IKY52_12020 [Clostridia bacterium]|nr:hypothetical protein [Clostridia bacterium]